MNNTRKEIIELIEPYMDKELSWGCYIQIDKKCKYEIFYSYNEINHIEEGLLYYNTSKRGDTIKFKDLHKIKIIGHYDITAVLKYIMASNKVYNVQIGAKCITFARYKEKGIILIPNKPLHLYTEQEEKDLLELLKKLGKN